MSRLAFCTGMACCLVVLACPAAGAADIPPAVLSTPCSTCHGPGGRSPGAIPSIDRLGADAIRTSLLAFKTDTVQGTIMNRLARGFSDAEIDAVAGYLGARTP